MAAPGGDVYDTPTNTRDITKAVLAAAPEAVLREAKLLTPSGRPKSTCSFRTLGALAKSSGGPPESASPSSFG